MWSFLVSTFLSKSCVACVAVAYSLLLGFVLWLILEAEIPLIAAKWHL
jgi:hypothetical protein